MAPQAAAIHAFSRALEQAACAVLPPGSDPWDLADAWHSVVTDVARSSSFAAAGAHAADGAGGSPAVDYLGYDHALMQIVPVAVAVAHANGGPMSLCSARLLDLQAAKLGAIVSAVSAACTLIKVDACVGLREETAL